MILDIALGVVLGIVVLAAAFFALIWIVEWLRGHWQGALLIGVPLALFLYAGVTDNAREIGASGLLLIAAILLDLWKQKRKNGEGRDRNEKGVS
jgi:hypothetical protein